MKALKAFINPLEAPQKSVKTKISIHCFSSSGIGTGRVKEKIVKLWNKLRAVPRNSSAGKQ